METINEKLDRLIEGIEQSGKKKKFRMPMGIKMQKGKIRKNYAIVLIIKTNGSVFFKMVQIEDNTIKIGETYHEATAKYVLRYRRFPMIILPEWNITPLSEPENEVFSPEKNLKEAMDKGKLSAAEKFILHAIKMDLVKAKPKMNIITIVVIIAAIGGLLWFLNNAGIL